MGENHQFLLYKSANGQVKLDVFLQDETVWLTQDKIAALFGVQRPAITKHLKNIFESGELEEVSVSSILELTANDGKQYSTKIYNLDAILSIGYRVNSIQATQFRKWASTVLKEYIIKGFAMNDERLKNPTQTFGQDYFEEQPARIRDIRSSERRFYQKITDIYAACSVDYDLNTEITKNFFATVQNKLHFAITGQTAAEIIHSRVNSKKTNMGLTTWKNEPKGTIRKTDVVIAKNYLSESELEGLNRIVTKLDAFLQFNEKEILQNSGTISHEVAIALAEDEFEKYRIVQDEKYVSDFDEEVKRCLE